MNAVANSAEGRWRIKLYSEWEGGELLRVKGHCMDCGSPFFVLQTPSRNDIGDSSWKIEATHTCVDRQNRLLFQNVDATKIVIGHPTKTPNFQNTPPAS